MASLYSLPKTGLVGAAVAAGLSSIYSSYRSYRAAAADPPFATGDSRRSSSKMKSFYRTPMIGGSRRKYVKRSFRPFRSIRYGKSRGDGSSKRLVRTGNVFQIGPIAAGVTAFGAVSPTLSYVQTSDLTGIYRYYRLVKVVISVVPRVDYANSGLASNFTSTIAACCDPEDTTVPAALTVIGAYDNSYQKTLTSGDRFKYTFYPKVVNAVGNAGVAAFVGGYGKNPWLQLSATGIVIPHNCLKYGIQVGSATTENFDCFYEYHFDVKGIA